MNAKAKGARRERQAKQMLEEQGHFVVKAAGSLGIFDLVALGVASVRLIQVKSNTRPRRAEMDRLLEFPCPQYASKELWVFVDRRRDPLIEPLGNAAEKLPALPAERK